MARLILLLVSAVLVPVAAQESDAQMRSRLCCDYAAGVTFRYPYGYIIPDQYVAGVVRERRSTAFARAGHGGDHARREQGVRRYDVRCLTTTLATLPAPLATAAVSDAVALGQIGDQLVASAEVATGDGVSLNWSPYDYYAPAGRPHAARRWAAKGVTAMLGDGDGICAVVVRHGDRCSALVLSGAVSDAANRAIIDSFEVLAGKQREAATWREAQTRQGLVFGSDGEPRPVDDGRQQHVPWTQAWDIETRHYHVTTDVSPRRLIDYGEHLEALYRAYAEVYDPDQVPPFKMEIHIFSTFEDFAEGAAANGIPVNPQMGGFFVPSLLSIFAFEDTSAHFHAPGFTVERVLAHECSHQFLHCACNGSAHVPTWINEGLAVYFEGVTVRNGALEILPPSDRVDELKATYARTRRTVRPLQEYLDHYDQLTADEYGEVYAMTHFWVFGSASGRKRFKDYWLALRAGENGTEAFERIFMVDLIKAHGSRQAALDAWQGKLLEYVQKRLR